MSTPYVGEIRIFAGNFAPQGWSTCAGQTIAISQNEVLYDLIGTTYGGDGVQTFNLPDLQGRAPVHQGNSLVIGERAGVESVVLTAGELPVHSHAVNSSSAHGNTSSPAGALWATDGTGVAAPYRKSGGTPVTLAPATVALAGSGQAHENRQPFLALTYIIALFGIFPSQN
ncbi:MAG: tail fiber protein [Bryobacteraceae bacterium]|nr:tail fiber protein [Bryobacteraceae bacterium]